jgi:hypothetical protein
MERPSPETCLRLRQAWSGEPTLDGMIEYMHDRGWWFLHKIAGQFVRCVVINPEKWSVRGTAPVQMPNALAEGAAEGLIAALEKDKVAG